MSDKKTTTKAKALLTGFLQQIAAETHGDPLITGPGLDDARMITKAEALGRHIWHSALGYKEKVEIIDKKSGAVLGVKEVIHYPDKAYVILLYDRLEGKVPTVEVKDVDRHASVVERVTKQSANRLNAIAKS